MDKDTPFSPRTSKTGRSSRVNNRIWGVAVLVVVLVGAWLVFSQWPTSEAEPAATETPTVTASESPSATPTATPTEVAPARPIIADFRMLDLDNGWIRHVDGTVKITADSGASWQDAGPDWQEPADAGETADGAKDEVVSASAKGTAVSEGEGVQETEGAKSGTVVDQMVLLAIEQDYLAFDPKKPVYMNGQQIVMKRVQPVSGEVGWALADDNSEFASTLLVTVDGGSTWFEEVTAEVRAGIEAEKARRALRAEEAALYASPALAMKRGWTLLPDHTYPGDLVLVRSETAGEVEWQGKTYTLQPYLSGYFMYLPIPRTTKPGTYPIGDAQLTVGEKTFKSQYLEVTKEMESMRKNTERIEADQKKINEARANSAPTFLFDSTFIEPLKGRLTTPFGYTRYVNGKLSSSHMAIDLAAPQGTPLKATNDGVVALADDLYLSGNTIYLDHGMGLFSQYGHLSEMHVKTGDEVKKGDIIGLVGTTGFSTGPHLHFTFYVHNIPSNPNLFFDTTPFEWLKEDAQPQ